MVDFKTQMERAAESAKRENEAQAKAKAEVKSKAAAEKRAKADARARPKSRKAQLDELIRLWADRICLFLPDQATEDTFVAFEDEVCRFLGISPPQHWESERRHCLHMALVRTGWHPTTIDVVEWRDGQQVNHGPQSGWAQLRKWREVPPDIRYLFNQNAEVLGYPNPATKPCFDRWTITRNLPPSPPPEPPQAKQPAEDPVDFDKALDALLADDGDYGNDVTEPAPTALPDKARDAQIKDAVSDGPRTVH